MINAATNLSHPTEVEAKPKFTSKISSPTKRTLNNKNYLAEDGPAYGLKPTLEKELDEKLKISSRNVGGPLMVDTPQLSRRNENEVPSIEKNASYLLANYQNNPLLSKPGYQQRRDPVLPTADGKNRLSPTKGSRVPIAKPKNPRCKEKNDASQVPSLDRLEKEKIMTNRYFSSPIDLHKLRRADGRLRPIINVASNGSKNNANHRTYKLAVPILTCNKSHQVVKIEIENNHRQRSSAENDEASISKIGDVHPHIAQHLRSAKKPTALKRPLLTGSSMNDSFDLSFDGKALDRSDIFRMVDSFTVAQSDDELDESPEGDKISSRNVLPAEMTSSAF